MTMIAIFRYRLICNLRFHGFIRFLTCRMIFSFSSVGSDKFFFVFSKKDLIFENDRSIISSEERNHAETKRI